MQRARTLSGLFVQLLRQRWGALGSRGRILVVSLAVAVTALGAQLAFCAFGGCAAGPCQLESRTPCHGAAMQSDAPCPYSAPAAPVAVEEAPADVPCHAR